MLAQTKSKKSPTPPPPPHELFLKKAVPHQFSSA